MLCWKNLDFHLEQARVIPFHDKKTALQQAKEYWSLQEIWTKASKLEKT